MFAKKIFEEPEVYKIEVPYANIVTHATNVYVIRDQGEVLIVDMGASTDEASEVLLGALAELDITIDSATYFFTHLHFDHSGLAQKLLLPGSEVFLGEKEMRSGESDFHKRIKEYVKVRFQEEGMTLHEAQEKTIMVEIATPIDRKEWDLHLVNGGDEIIVGRFAFNVVELPGHTRGMSGLYQPDSGLCFSGDQILFCITPVCGLFLDGEDSIDEYDQSTERLMRLPITHLFHSHGEIRADFRERAEEIHASRERRMQKIVDLVIENPGINGVEIVRNMGWKVPFASIDDCEQRQQWLIYTQGIAMIDHVVRTGAIERVREPSLSGMSAMSHTYEPAF